MKWRIVQENWPAFFEHIEERWPQVEEEDLIEIGGDRQAFTDYVARVHDLTPAEAREEIATWIEGDLPLDVYMDERHDNESIRDSGRSIPTGEDVYDDDRMFGDDGKDETPIGRTT